MAVYKIFSRSVTCEYKCTLCSKATFFVITTLLLTIILPLLIVYRSHGFWLKHADYREQPDIHFKHEYLLIVETDKLEEHALCSTFNAFNRISLSNSHCSMIKTREIDINRDGKYEELNLEIEVQLENGVNVHSVLLLLIFDYKLYKVSVLQMESLGIIQHSSSLPGARLDITGDLQLVQKQPLYTRGRDLRYNSSIIDMEKLFPDAFNLQKLFQNYARRNVSTHLSHTYSLWTAGRAFNTPFIISAIIHYPEMTISYYPGFWQVIKWAWIQYISVLIVFVYVFRKLKTFMFDNQLIFTVKDLPWKKQF